VTPNFDEMVGSELTAEERERLLRVHELLVLAGPPPELTPQLEQAPEGVEKIHVLRRRNVGRRAVFLIAAALLIAIVFVGGFSVGHSGGGKVALALSMKGTSKAPRAQGALSVFLPTQGNWPMRLSVTGLPENHQGSYYDVYLVRDGKPWGSCGTFKVSNSSQALSVPLTAPYALRSGDSWVVTLERPGQKDPGQTVLRPARL
jgi:hypothetical protein